MGTYQKMFHYTGCAVAFIGGLIAQTSERSEAQGVGVVTSICALLSILIPAWLADRKDKREKDLKLLSVVQENQNIKNEALAAKDEAKKIREEHEKLLNRVNVLDVKNAQVDANTERLGITEHRVDASSKVLEDMGYLKPQENIRLGNILIVEDDTVIAKALIRLFSLNNFISEYTNSSEEAIKKLQDEREFDWVILDLNLIESKGETVLEAIKENNLRTRVVITTGSMDNNRINQVQAMGPDRILIKPIDFNELLSLLRSNNESKQQVTSDDNSHL